MTPGAGYVKRCRQIFTNTSYLVAARQGILENPGTPRTLLSPSQSQPRQLGRFPQNAEALPIAVPECGIAARDRGDASPGEVAHEVPERRLLA